MKQFMVAYMNFFDNELKMEQVEAECELESVLKSSFVEGFELRPNETMETIKTFFFDSDALISAKQIELGDQYANFPR